MTGSPSLLLLPFAITSPCERLRRRDCARIIFLNGITKRCRHWLVRNSPWTMFLYGPTAPKRKSAAPPSPHLVVAHPGFLCQQVGARSAECFCDRRRSRDTRSAKIPRP